jgi:hypothetical protein
MQTRSRQTGTLTHHGNGLHAPPGRNEAVHLRLHLNREPVPQGIPHTRIEPHGPHPGATTIRRLIKHPYQDKTLFKDDDSGAVAVMCAPGLGTAPFD